jgi:predicted aspartyl protease
MHWQHIISLGYFITAVSTAGAQDLTGGRPTGLPGGAGAHGVAAIGEEVKLERQGGTYAVPVLINRAITLKFVLDSGASDVLIPADVFLTLLRTGTVSESDFLGSQVYSLADDSKLKGTRFIIRELKVGDDVASNVVASVGPVSGDLLLGLSFLSRFGSVTLDNERHVLILSGRASVQSKSQPQRDEQTAVTVPPNPDSSSPMSVGVAAFDRGDYAIALQSLQPAAQAGDGLAQYFLGVMYLKGQGVVKNPYLGLEWLTKAAAAGAADAQSYMGAFNRRGDLVPQNYAEAMRWYLLAAKQNHEIHSIGLRLCTIKGRAFSQTFVRRTCGW